MSFTGFTEIGTELSVLLDNFNFHPNMKIVRTNVMPHGITNPEFIREY